MSPSCAPVFSSAHCFQAPGTQAIFGKSIVIYWRPVTSPTMIAILDCQVKSGQNRKKWQFLVLEM